VREREIRERESECSVHERNERETDECRERERDECRESAAEREKLESVKRFR
jgi:hypothetical protein